MPHVIFNEILNNIHHFDKIKLSMSLHTILTMILKQHYRF